jgi:hypothetical protein
MLLPRCGLHVYELNKYLRQCCCGKIWDRRVVDRVRTVGCAEMLSSCQKVTCKCCNKTDGVTLFVYMDVI